MSSRPAGVVVFLALLLAALPAASAQDADRDGLTDAQEEQLGTDPRQPDRLHVLVQDAQQSERRRKRPGYDATKDVVKLEFCHVAEDRYLWRVTLAAPPRRKDTVLHLYIDADSNKQTGRKGRGNEYMVSVMGAGARTAHYAPDGKPIPASVPGVVVDGNAILMSADLNLGRDAKGVRYRINVLCHTMVLKPLMQDGIGPLAVSGIPVTRRKKVKRLEDQHKPFGVEGTFGQQGLRKIELDPRNIVVRHDQLKLDGFEVDHGTSRRWPHLRRTGRVGRATTRAPKGRYHVGFMTYDHGADVRVAILIDKQLKGLARTVNRNRRTWLFWLTKAHHFKGGEEVQLAAIGGDRRHALINCVFLPKPPPARQVPYEVRYTAARVPVRQSGVVRVSWTTSMPSVGRFEYGRTQKYGKAAETKESTIVHRVVLKGLRTGVTWHGRAVGTKPDGTRYRGPDIEFTADQAKAPPTLAGTHTVPITVRNPHAVTARRCPVTHGVPFPKAALSDVANVRLLQNGSEVPAQVHPSGLWPDGSIKWILLSFAADVPAGATARYDLEFGRRVRRRPQRGVTATPRGQDVLVDTGALRFRINSRGNVVLPKGGACRTLIRDSSGVTYSTAGGKAAIAVEENGPMRVVVKTVNHATAKDGTQSFRIEQRIAAYRGGKSVRIWHTFVNDRPEKFTNIEAMSFDVPSSVRSWRAASAKGGDVVLDSVKPRVWQRSADDYLVRSGRREAAVKGRLTGTLTPAGSGSLAIAVRDAWQNYPKGFALAPDKVRLALCPDFEKGWYDKFPFEREGNQLYYYLLDGHYRLKSGLAKTHELLLCFEPEQERATAAAMFQRPLLATPDPKWMCKTQAFYTVAPRDTAKFKAYEEGIDSNLKRYAEACERQHDYGLMNYGDWFGERRANWGNIEYDTQFCFFLEYIRSGNPLAFFLGEAAQIHNRDIDTIQWARDPRGIGLAYVHQMGHVGGYYKKRPAGTLGIPRAGGSVSHAWVEGHLAHYFLTGDSRSLAAGRAVADYFTRKMLRGPYDFLSCRTPGWHLIILAAAYAATDDPYYLNAARVIVDRVIEAQDVTPRPMPPYQVEPGRTHQVGGWSRMMVPGHCRCIPRHRGNAGFMVAVLLSGMKYYYDATGDPRAKECIIRGCHYLIDETYSDRRKGFRYTSCPNGRFGTGASPLMVEAIARAYLWTKDKRFKAVLAESLPIRLGGSSYGKGFSMYYRCGPRLLADIGAAGLTLNERIVPIRVPFKKPAWMKKLSADELIVIQAEHFAEEGIGRVRVAFDRQGCWGNIITSWHADIGHWVEWRFGVPKAGSYKVIFHWASGSERPRRTFKIDGKSPDPAADEIIFRKTGGYGSLPDDWRFRTLSRASGKPVLLRLAKGKHKIRMSNLGDGLALDFIALVRVR